MTKSLQVASTAVAALTVLLGGCVSNLSVQPVGADANAAVAGYPYRLKMTQFEIPVTWRVVKCDATNTEAPVAIKIGAEIKTGVANDPQQFYAVDPRSLQGLFRNSEFTMEWFETRGTKSITSTADDQTGAVLADLAAGAVKLVEVGIGAPNGPGFLPDCGPLNKILLDIGDQKAVVDQAQADVADQTLVVARFAARAAALGANLDDKTRDELAAANLLLESQTAKLKLEQGALDGLLDEVTAKTTVTFPNRGDQRRNDTAIELPEAKRKAWKVEKSAVLSVWFKLSPQETLPSGAAAAGAAAPKGLPYREPLLGRIEVCSSKPCGEDKSELVKKLDTQVLQLGKLFYLPFRAQTFANVKNGATFSENGVLLTATASQPRGAGAGAASAFKGVSEQAAAYVEADRTAETKRLQAKVDEAKARKALAEATLIPKPDTDADKKAQIAAYETDATLAKAEVAKIEAEMARDAARAVLAQ